MQQGCYEKSYGQLLDELSHVEKNSDSELEIYQKLVKLCEKEIGELDVDSPEDFIGNDESGCCIPDYLDNYVAPMDNLARIYIERNEYEKALPLLERVLPVYRTLEIYDSNFTYQRCYAIEAIVKCLEQLGKKTLSILYGYELKHLKLYCVESKRKCKNQSLEM